MSRPDPPTWWLLLCLSVAVLLPSPVVGLSAGSVLFDFTGGEVFSPYGVFFDRQGRLYASDALNSQVVVFAPLPASAPPIFTDVIATFDAGGAIDSAECVAVDGSGYIYLCDSRNNRILVLAGIDSVNPPAGTLLFAFNDTTPPMQYPGPDGVALDSNGSIYVADQSNNRVVVLASIRSSSPGLQLASFSDSGGLPLSDPSQLCFDADDRLFIGDSGNGRIVVLASLTSTTASPGTELYSFNDSDRLSNTNGVALDAAGNIYLTSSDTQQVVVLSGLNSTYPGTQLGVINNVWNGVPFEFPYLLAIDALGRLYVSDSNNYRIDVFPSFDSPSFAAMISQVRTSEYSLSDPAGLVIDSEGRMLIADSNNGRVVVWSSPTSSTPGAPITALYDVAHPLIVPIAVALDQLENLYVSDIATNRVVVLAGLQSTSPVPGTEIASFSNCTVTWGVGWYAGQVYVIDNGPLPFLGITEGNLIGLYVLAGIDSVSPPPGTILHFFNDTDPPLQFEVTGLTFDSVGNMYLASTGPYGAASTIYVIASLTSTTAMPLTQLAAYIDPSINGAYFPVVDPYGRIYIADVGNGRVVVLASLSSASPGAEIASFNGSGAVSVPTGMALDASGNMYTASFATVSVVVLVALPAPTSASGDPLFTGFLGQRYQVHGLHGVVYSIISCASLQLNARFMFLHQGGCPVYGHYTNSPRPAGKCFSHPGSYFGAIGVRTASGSRLLLLAGSARTGFASIQLDERELKHMAAKAEAAAGEQRVETADLSLALLDRHHVQVRHGIFTLLLDSSDGFINIGGVSVSSFTALSQSVKPHGLLGQSWQRRSGADRGKDVAEVEGVVDDYSVADADIFGIATLYSQFEPM